MTRPYTLIYNIYIYEQPAANDRIGSLLRTTMNDATQNDRNVDAAVLTADRKTGTVYVVLDDSFTRGIKIEVTEDDDVSSIKDKIMERKKNFFASFDADDLILCESKGTTKLETESTSDNVEIPLNSVGRALNVFEEWNIGVTWGTKDKPLIVVHSPPAITKTNHNGECSVFVCECAFVDEIFLNCYVMRNASLYIYCKFVVFSCDF